VASIITVNPSLNLIAINGMIAGATLAVTPNVAPKILEKILKV
jgi:hypothetical protein